MSGSNDVKNCGRLSSIISTLESDISPQGAIRSVKSTDQIIKFMRESSHLPERFIVVNILRVTSTESVEGSSEAKENISRFYECGGWEILDIWFTEFAKHENVTVMVDFINMLSILPVTISLLKKGGIARTLKKISKCPNKEIQLASKKLILRWKKLVIDQNSPSSGLNKNESSKKKKSSQVLENMKNVSDSTNFMKCLNEISVKSNTKRRVSEGASELTIQNISLPQKPLLDRDVEMLDLSDPPIQSNKKRVRFKADDALVNIYYFEMTEHERIEMHGMKTDINYNEARHLESLSEKKVLQEAKTIEPIIIDHQWKKPERMEDCSDEIKNSINSTERDEQGNRESSILAPIFLTKNQVPETPVEFLSIESVEMDKLQLVVNNYTFIHPIPFWETMVVPEPKVPENAFPVSRMRGGTARRWRSGGLRRDTGPRQCQPYNYQQKPNIISRGNSNFRKLQIYPIRNFPPQNNEFNREVNYDNVASGRPPLISTPTYRGRNIRRTSNLNAPDCIDWRRGNCRYGHTCKYVHGQREQAPNHTY